MVEGKPHQLPDQEKGAQLPVARCEQESERRARRGKRKKDVLQQDGQGGMPEGDAQNPEDVVAHPERRAQRDGQ